MLPLRLDMKTPATENALSLGTDVGEIFNKALSKRSRFSVLMLVEQGKGQKSTFKVFWCQDYCIQGDEAQKYTSGLLYR